MLLLLNMKEVLLHVEEMRISDDDNDDKMGRLLIK